MAPKTRKRGPGRPPGRQHTDRLVVLLRPDARARYEAAAAELGVGLSEWVREAMDAAARGQRITGNKPDAGKRGD